MAQNPRPTMVQSERFFGGPPSSYAKAIVSVIMSALLILETFFGWTIEGLDERWITTALALIWPLLVLLVPNRT